MSRSYQPGGDLSYEEQEWNHAKNARHKATSMDDWDENFGSPESIINAVNYKKRVGEENRKPKWGNMVPYRKKSEENLKAFYDENFAEYENHPSLMREALEKVPVGWAYDNAYSSLGDVMSQALQDFERSYGYIPDWVNNTTLLNYYKAYNSASNAKMNGKQYAPVERVKLLTGPISPYSIVSRAKNLNRSDWQQRSSGLGYKYIGK